MGYGQLPWGAKGGIGENQALSARTFKFTSGGGGPLWKQDWQRVLKVACLAYALSFPPPFAISTSSHTAGNRFC